MKPESIGEALKHSSGARAGKLIKPSRGLIEICILEREGRCYFHLYFYGKTGTPEPLPSTETIKLRTIRPDRSEETFAFRAVGNALESTSVVPPPHAFTIRLSVDDDGQVTTHET